MTKYLKFTLIPSLILLFACSKQSTQPNVSYNINGKVIYQNQAISNVDVSLKEEDRVIKTTFTDNNGKFEFSDISKGKYKLVARKNFSDSSFIEQSTNLDVSRDLQLENLILPEPVILYQPIDVTWTTVTLSWSSFIPDQFYEYRVYRNTLPAVSENSGEPVYISTVVSDTTYYDNLMVDGVPARNETFYYRIYVNNQFGKMSGSNILKVTTDKWENDSNFTVNYQLNSLESFAVTGSGTIAGIDYDGESLWLLTIVHRGGYYDADSINLFKYNYQSGDIIKSFNITNEYAESMALSCSNNNLWISIDATSNRKILKIDSNSGNILNTYSTTYGICDLTSDGNSLLINYYFNRIEKVDLNNLGIIDVFNNPFGSSANFGIAHRQGEIWLSCKSDNQLAILDENGIHIGVANTDLLSNWNGYDSHLYLCFMNNKLVMVKNSTVYILEIQ